MTPGQVIAFKISGEVTITDATGTRPLAEGVPFTEGATIRTGDASSAVLVQSNGASIIMEELTSLSISEFVQAPFSGSATFAKLEQDPSQSRTRIRVNLGTASGDVKRLNPTSSYNIETPTGSAGIRGTQWRVTVVVDFVTGRITVLVRTLEGEVNYQNQAIPAGTEVTDEGEITDASTEDNVIVSSFTTGDVEATADEVAQAVLEQIQSELNALDDRQDQMDLVENIGTEDSDVSIDQEDIDAVESTEDVISDGTTPPGDTATAVDEFSPAGG